MTDKKEKKFEYLYGPVSSWRLGTSLGVDLISSDQKICSLACLYCQLGATMVKTKKRSVYVPTKKVMEEIKALPVDLKADYITFSGMGEPTMAANLGDTIKEIRALRKDKIAVITNSSLMGDKSVRQELALADLVLAKLDACDEKSFKEINDPAEGLKFSDVYNGIKAFKKEYGTRLAVQIMFFGLNKDRFKELAKAAFDVKPDEIQINTPLRPCGVEPLSPEEIRGIKKYFDGFAKKSGSKTTVVSVYDKEGKEVEAMSRKDTLRRRGKPA
jgi:wyosine [tRNA(Phe)-imidazoG37] synthetase (radical SAM superfamily)